MYDPYAEFRKSVLPNGLEVYSLNLDRSWIKVQIVVHSGGKEDSVSRPGLAHFVEHLVSKNIPGLEYDEAREFFETVGGNVAFGRTSYESTIYNFEIPADMSTFQQALRMFGSMLIGTKLKNYIERERKVIHSEFNRKYHPITEALNWTLRMRGALFNGHRLETFNSALGRLEGILSFTETDFQNFYDAHYVPANMSMVVVGNIGIDQLLDELRRSPFGMEKAGTKNPFPKILKSLPFPSEHGQTIEMSKYVSSKIDQTEYLAAWAFPADFPVEARKVFDDILINVLRVELREKLGLTYSFNTSNTSFQDVYEYRISGACNPSATGQIDKLVQECISLSASRQDLFDRMLKSRIKKCLMTDLSGSALARLTADELGSDHRIITVQEWWDELHKVRHEQMAEIATNLLCPERKYTLITHP